MTIVGKSEFVVLYQTQNYCINPFGLSDHKKRKLKTSKIQPATAKKIKALGINFSNRDHICSSCRIKIRKSDDYMDNETPEVENIEIDAQSSSVASSTEQYL